MMQFDNNLKTAIKAALDAGKAILEVYHTADFGIETKEDNSPLTLADQRAHHIIVKALEHSGLPILSEEGKSIPYETRSQWQAFWLVDPLDGTKEFIKRNGEFTVNIALIKNGNPVAGVIYVPVTDVLYTGVVGEAAYLMSEASKQLEHKEPEQCQASQLPYITHQSYGIVASRSHLNEKTTAFINEMKKQHDNVRIISKGSSLKICMVAEGEADVYPRFGPTSEWDTAAGHAIALASGATVTIANTSEPLTYNKENILNPWFIVKRN